MHRFSVALAFGVVAVLPLGGPAQAYVGASGTGGRAASVTIGRPLTVTGTVAVFANNAKTNDPPIAVTASLSNPNSFHRWAHTVTAVFGSSSRSGCTAAAYQINGSPQSANQAVAPGTGTLAVPGISVALVNGNCKGATVTVSYSVT